MQIWIDADACPKVIKEILFRAAKRTQTNLILVANQFIAIPPSPFIKMIQVKSGFDVADNYIVKHLSAKDLVVTADIPLADEVITAGAFALNPRGEMYSANTIKQRLNIRDFNDCMRGSGMMTGGPDKISQKEIQLFANALDRLLETSRR